MTYQDTVNWMFSQLPMYQNQGKKAYKANLDNTFKLAKNLNYPETHFKSIHVAGTNGKGSTSHLLASVLQEAGYSVGLYTSPHLKDFRERIKINGVEISEAAVIGFVKKQKSFFEHEKLSFFEMTVGMAFDYFSRKKVDIAIIEVGLGGRLDSTNIISPLVSVITNIGKDHTQFLGTTLSAIAGEKAGIIKKDTPVVIGETQNEITEVFLEKAKQCNAEIYFADQLNLEPFQTDLKGNYQSKNSNTALAAIHVLNSVSDFNISELSIKKGFLNVIKNTGLKGRWQILQNKPKVICDTAHNAEGLAYTMKQLQTETYNKLHLVFGVVSDKDLSQIFHLLPKNVCYYFCAPKISRAMPVSELVSFFKNKGVVGKGYRSVKLAYTKALSQANAEDLIYVGGSTFVVSEII